MKFMLNHEPKDIHEGTINHVMLALNSMDDYGQHGEAEYLLMDLLDQLVSRALVITQRVAPLDHTAIESLKQEEYKRGVADGCKLGAEKARKQLIAKVAEVLQ